MTKTKSKAMTQDDYDEALQEAYNNPEVPFLSDILAPDEWDQIYGKSKKQPMMEQLIAESWGVE